MKLTGTKIRESLQIWAVRKEAGQKAFRESLMGFSDERKNPIEEAAALEQADLAIAYLQEAQAQYNVLVHVEALGTNRTLAFWIKALGVYERMGAHWKGALEVKERGYFRLGEGGSDVRKKDEERKQPTIKPNVIAREAAVAMKQAAEVRSAIARANQREMEVDIASVYLG